MYILLVFEYIRCIISKQRKCNILDRSKRTQQNKYFELSVMSGNISGRTSANTPAKYNDILWSIAQLIGEELHD